MSEVQKYIDICKSKYPFLQFKVYDIMEPTLNHKYGTISIVKIISTENTNEPLVVIPGYSFKSFNTMCDKLLEGINIIKDTFSVIYFINWGETIKQKSIDCTKGIVDEREQFEINERFREEMAIVLDKILRSKDMHFIEEGQSFSLLGKSAGGGISIYIASMNMYVDRLFLCAPATITGGSLLKDRTSKKHPLDILLSWNKDDKMIPYQKHEQFVSDFEEQGNIYSMFLYEEGGHELNVNFLMEL